MAAPSDDGSAARAAREALTREFRRLRPAKVRVVVEGVARDVAIPGKRHKWEALCNVLDKLEWTRVECLDAKGALLDNIDAVIDEPAPDEDATSALAVLGKAPGGLDREHGLLVLMLKAQEVALKHQASAMSVVVQGHRELAGLLLGRLESHEAALEKVLRLAHDAASRVAGATSAQPDEDPTDKMMMELLKHSGVLPGAGGVPSEKALEALVERVGRKLLTPPVAAATAAPNGTKE